MILVQNQPNQLDSTLICTNELQKNRFNSRQFVGRSTLLSIVMMRSPELMLDRICLGLNESLSHDTAPICLDLILLRVLSIRRQMHTNSGEWVSQYCLPHLIHQQIFYDWQTEQAHVYIWNDSDSLFMVQWDLILSTFNFLCINLKIHICFKALSHLYCHIFIFSLDKYAKLFINVIWFHKIGESSQEKS